MRLHRLATLLLVIAGPARSAATRQSMRRLCKFTTVLTYPLRLIMDHPPGIAFGDPEGRLVKPGGDEGESADLT